MKTIKIKSTDRKNQGDYVLINEADYDAKKHTKFEAENKKANKKKTK